MQADSNLLYLQCGNSTPQFANIDYIISIRVIFFLKYGTSLGMDFQGERNDVCYLMSMSTPRFRFFKSVDSRVVSLSKFLINFDARFIWLFTPNVTFSYLSAEL